MGKYFGTDGVRGIANTELTPELAFKIGRVSGYVLTKETTSPTVVIGRDTRLSGEMLESALVSGLVSVGIEVFRLGVLPTPAVAYFTKSMEANAGIMISASHNPFEDNGIKIFNSDGFKLTEEVELQIENLLDAEDVLPRPIGKHIGKISNFYESKTKYIQFIKHTVEETFNGMKIVIDCANGASTPIVSHLFADLEAEVIILNGNPDGININAECGSTNPKILQKCVVEEKADLGIAFDGDADRLIAVDEKGQIIDGDQLLYICGNSLKEKGKLKNNTVVSTVMSNFGFKQKLESEGTLVKQTAVGDKYVVEEMRKCGYNLGGEQSGHIVFLDLNTTGDGILAAVQLINVMKEKNMPLSQLAKPMVKYPQIMINVKVKDKFAWEKDELILTTIKEKESQLIGKGRILIRPSGTESLVRVMAEGEDEKETTKIVESIAETIRSMEDLKQAN